ncbi:four helix bundle protein [Rubritalea marina]|uniref:four helix bundle protein n=1 Tax=Rubritalea marina TaxID=361055 RepID=UPI00037D2F79|nr:four helix bundle protein [Rubritalea marina]
MIKTFEDLDVWKRSCQMAVDVYSVLQDSKDYGLKDQMQRAAVSIASNIAEGSDRGSTAEYIRFLRYSKASCAELRTQLYIAQRIRKNSNQESLQNGTELIQESKEISAMLQALINTLEQKTKTPTNPKTSNQ